MACAESIPNEMWVKILEETPSEGLGRLECVSRRLHALVRDYFWMQIIALSLDLNDTDRGGPQKIVFRLQNGRLFEFRLPWVLANSLLAKVAQVAEVRGLTLDVTNWSAVNNNRVLSRLAKQLSLDHLEHLFIWMREREKNPAISDFGPWEEQARILCQQFILPRCTSLKTLHLILDIDWWSFHSAASREAKPRIREVFREPIRACRNLETLSFWDTISRNEPMNQSPPLLIPALEGNNSLTSARIGDISSNVAFQQREVDVIINLNLPLLEELGMIHHLFLLCLARLQMQRDPSNPFGNIVRLQLTSYNDDAQVQTGVVEALPHLRFLSLNHPESLPIHIGEFLRIYASGLQQRKLAISCWHDANFRASRFRPDDLIQSVLRDIHAVKFEEMSFKPRDWPDWKLFPDELPNWKPRPWCASWLVFQKGMATVRVKLEQPLVQWTDVSQTNSLATSTYYALTDVSQSSTDLTFPGDASFTDCDSQLSEAV